MCCSFNGACAHRSSRGLCSCKAANQNCTLNCLCNKAKCKTTKRKNLISYMKSFLAYFVFVLQVSEAVEAEQVNTPVDPDGEVQLFNEQTSTTQIETLLLFVHKYTVV